jgi:hypothetical protein
MAIERLKFRCYSCNQLLGATPNKAGSIVTCPKCSAELLIPVPELRVDEGPEAQSRKEAAAPVKPRPEVKPKSEPELTVPAEPAAPATTGPQSVPRPAPPASYLDELAAALPPDLIDLKPEDLRVEAEFFESLSRQPQVPVIREPAPWPPAEAPLPNLATESYASPSQARPVIETSSTQAPPMVSSVLTETVDLAPRPPALPPSVQLATNVETALLGTSIEIERPTILPAGTVTRRVSEITLPASVVLAWSLFVLLAIALSFTAGLLMGHFLWRTH